MRSRITSKTLDFSGPSTLEEIEWADRQYPTASDAEKYRLVQAQRLLNWYDKHWVPTRRRRRAKAR